MSGGIGLTTSKTSLEDILATGSGFLAQTASRLACNSSGAWTSGDERATLIALRAGMVVTNLHCCISSTASSGVTTQQLALWSKTGTLLCNSANDTGAWAANSVITKAAAAAYTVPTDDVYYIGGLIVATTMPTMLRSSTTGGMQVAATSGSAQALGVGSKAALDDPMTVSNTSANATWFAVS